MKIDINDYKASSVTTQKWYIENGKGDFRNAISIIPASTMVPCIVVCFQLGEIMGWTDEVVDRVNFFIKVYGYTQVLNIPEGFPKERLSI